MGLLIGGIIDGLIPKEYISKFLGGSGIKTLLWSTFLGFLLSACSHGILSIAVALYKKGATTAATLTFLLAAPWANPAITVIILTLFKTQGLMLIFSALIIALISGLIFQILEKKGLIEQGQPAEIKENFSLITDIKRRWQGRKTNLKKICFQVSKSSWNLAKMTLYWILIGIFVGSIISAYLPNHILSQFFGSNLLGIVLTLAAAAIIEVCSEGSAPIAFELYRQTKALGNSMVFLQAGVVTDYTEIGLIATNIGRKAAIALPIVTVPQVILLGLLLNYLF